MADIFSKRKRSDVMSRIRGAGNKATELELMRFFRANGITGWRRGCSLSISSGVRGLASGDQSPKPKTPNPKSKTRRRVRPDFVFPIRKLAVFVDGCFWHGCPKHATWPKTRAAFWLAKITGNQARDRRVNYALRKRGWAVLRIWEHELSRKNEARLLTRLRKVL